MAHEDDRSVRRGESGIDGEPKAARESTEPASEDGLGGRRELLRSRLEAWIPEGSEVALIDVPVNRNAGDLFILAAAERLLSDLRCHVVYRSGVRDYRTARARALIGPRTIVVCMGGGSFGDLYPRYQALRERVAHDFPRNRIVVLPQSVRFASTAELEHSAARLARHPDLCVAVRDRPSLELVRRHVTDQVELLPDLVHWIEPAVCGQPEPEASGTLRLMRRDAERNAVRARPEVPAVDWPELLSGFYPRLVVAAALMPLCPAFLSRRLQGWWASYSGRLLEVAIERMREVRHVVTDRLHGAIVARIAGRSVSLLENSYGKLGAYYDAWWQEDRAVEPPRHR